MSQKINESDLAIQFLLIARMFLTSALEIRSLIAMMKGFDYIIKDDSLYGQDKLKGELKDEREWIIPNQDWKEDSYSQAKEISTSIINKYFETKQNF